jgi:hypothetical protein
VSPFLTALPLKLVIKRTIIIIVLVIALLIALPLSAPVLNLIACIPVMDDVTQVMVVTVTPSAMLLWWSDAAGQVSTGTLPVVMFVTLVSILPIVGWIRYGRYV